MKISTITRCRPLWILLLLVSFAEAKPQGYVYPVPTSSVSTTASTITTQGADNVTGTPETTTAFGGYIIEGKENSSALAEGINTPATEDKGSSETEPSTSTDGEARASTEQPNASEEPENEDSTDVSTDANDVKDESEKNEDTPTTAETPENEETTTTSDDTENTTLLSGPYPPSGVRPIGRDFSYNVQDLFPGTKVASSSPKSSSSFNDLSIETQVSRQPVNLPIRQQPIIQMNRPANQAYSAPTYPGPQRPYFYQSPSQNLQNNHFPQRPVVNRNFPSQRFVQSYPSRTYLDPAPYPSSVSSYDQRFSASKRAPYPPSVSSYDQRYSASEPVKQSFSAPRGNEYYAQPQYEFAYDVRAPPYGPFFGHRESRSGDAAQGRYYVVQPDGRMRVVDYEAGPRGYRPSISYESTLTYQDYP